MDPLERLVPELSDYARKLIDAGFTVHVPKIGRPPQHTFMHYSREVDGQTCYGTVQRAEFHRLGQPLEHTMPIAPSRLNGSSAIIGARFGDMATLGLDLMERDSVEYAEAVARPSNWCPYNAQPTVVNVALGESAPRPLFTGARLANHKPDGIDTRFVAVSHGETAVQS